MAAAADGGAAATSSRSAVAASSTLLNRSDWRTSSALLNFAYLFTLTRLAAKEEVEEEEEEEEEGRPHNFCEMVAAWAGGGELDCWLGLIAFHLFTHAISA